ncbi:hypothetical protein [Vreelandella rituensis]|uniref:Uncharacterized protein n=1 Tax=Vreelandella rituensis TaxID=2282306 RepID=A0A368TMY4_9GAMM|nr:hypothetical protein [Halomonas rituensis]RCV86035.1 hypothetical protein DU506_19295 [Halomonas rituensis]
MVEKTKRTISVSLEQSQIEMIDAVARQERVSTGENVTRSQVVRWIVDAAMNEQGKHGGPTPAPSPASINTPAGGRTAERSDGGAGGIQQRQGG